jgi:small-conductance mechanosensitive channel
MELTAVRAARPHIVRATAALVVLVAALVVGRTFGRISDVAGPGPPATKIVIGIAALVVVVVAGIITVRASAAATRAAIGQHEAYQHMAPLGLVVSFLGYLCVVVCVLVLLNRPVGGILLGGALTGVLVGIAAQQVLANFFAGLVLLIVRPFTITDEIVLKSGPLGGEYEGLVVDMGLFYVKLDTHTGQVSLPNAGVLAAAVGPGVRAAEEEPELEEPEEATAGPTASGQAGPGRGAAPG